MVAVAALFTTYLLTQTRRSRRQIWYETTHPLLRIRNRTITVHFVYVYVLLIRKLRLRIHILIRLPRLYTYTFTVSVIITVPITATTIINLTYRPILFITVVLLYLPSYLLSIYIYYTLSISTTSGVRPEVRCSAEARPLYTYTNTYTNYVY